MSCGPTHYAGCACHEERWAERLAASEARVRALEETLSSAKHYLRSDNPMRAAIEAALAQKGSEDV